MKIKIIIDKEFDQYSLRRFIRINWPHINQSLLHKSIRTGDIRINGDKIDEKINLKTDDILAIWDKLLEHNSIISHPFQFNFLKEHIIDQTEHMWVINKPNGLAVQGGNNVKISLDFLLSGWMNQFNQKPHLVHRIDKHTSGLILIATGPKASYQLTSLFANRQINKKYLAVCVNNSGKQFMKNEVGKFKDEVDEKDAITQYKVLGLLKNKMLLMEFTPITGRKHQIRKHCQAHQIPILGDTRYGQSTQKHLFLHAFEISSNVNTGLLKPFHYQAPLPDHMKQFSNFIDVDY